MAGAAAAGGEASRTAFTGGKTGCTTFTGGQARRAALTSGETSGTTFTSS